MGTLPGAPRPGASGSLGVSAMVQPARETASRKDRLAFTLTVLAVVLSAALLGYLLGHYAFSRWVGPTPGPAARPALAELGTPAPVAPSSRGGLPGQVSSAPPPAPAEAPAPAAAEPPADGPVARPAPPPAPQAPARAPAASPPGPSLATVSEEQARIQGHFVQVGAFSQPELARRASQRLQEDGYPVRVVTTRGPDGRILYYKVWVGPYPSRAAAVQAREQLGQRWDNPWIP